MVLAITTWLRWYLPGTYVLPFVINRYFFREWLWKYVKSSSVHYHTLSLTVIDISHMYNILQQCKLPNYGFDFSLTIILSPGRKSFIFSQFVYSLIYLCQCGLKDFYPVQLFILMLSQSQGWPVGVTSGRHLCPPSFTEHFLTSWTKCSRLTLSFPCPSPGISHFSPKPW